MNYRFEITDSDLILAKKNIWSDSSYANILAGNVGEIIACKYLNIDYNKTKQVRPDTGYDIYANNIKYQVKSVEDQPYKNKIYLERKDYNKNFDRYLLILIAQYYNFAEILVDSDIKMIENNCLYDEEYGKFYLKIK